MHEKGWVARIVSSYFCVQKKGTANGVCPLGAPSLSSTLSAYSCATKCQAQSLLFKAQSVPRVCTATDLHSPFQTHIQTLEILPLLLTTLPAQADFPHLWYEISASPDQGVCASTYISAPQSVQTAWKCLCWVDVNIRLPYPPEPEGDRWGRKSEEASFLCSTPGGGWDGEPAAVFAATHRPACTEGEGRRTCSHSPSRLDLLSPHFANLNYTLYIVADERRWLICRQIIRFFCFLFRSLLEL